ncbi:MAG: hypothetical protein JXA01_03245 [Dehalococcoidia bacterium]|nr:hypothetical protein [Dehalococcoidia bacterium]
MAEAAKKSANFTYEALAKMSRLVYEKFGDEALPVIRDIWYELGLASGSLLKDRVAGRDFKSAAGLMAERSRKSGELGTCRITDTLFHITTPAGYHCDVGLDDTSRVICEAVMSVNRGQLKAICGCDVEMDILKSRANGDDCCDIIYRPINESDK